MAAGPRDLPAAMARHARWISRAALAVVILGAVLTLVDAYDGCTGAEDAAPMIDPWLGLAVGFLSAAAIGVDAMAIGVRRRADRGPSIANLAPGAWAIFASMMWIVAVPAYFFGARRKTVRGTLEEAPREPIGAGSYVAIAVLAVIGVTMLVAH